VSAARFIRRTAAGLFLAAVFGLSAMPTSTHADTIEDQVWATERAFARTMAERKLAAFAAFIADDAVFFSGTTALRGKGKVVQAWAPDFSGPQAPFSWEPDQVEVLASGTLALSTGPVRDPDGKIIARFTSIWRLDAPDVWHIVFDKGGPPSPGPK
jgi:ketosteroid isomerase-like protein